MLMQSDVPSGSPLEHALRKYPSVVPHRIQKSVRSSGDKEFKYASNFFIPSLYRMVQGVSSDLYSTVFYGKTNPHNHCGMDTVEVRRQRLKALVNERYRGIQANMVRDTGINAGELSGLMRNKHFGEKKARALERQLGLPDLWFDGIDAQKGKEALDDFQWILQHGAESEKSILLATIDAIKSMHKQDFRSRELPVIRDRRKKA